MFHLKSNYIIRIGTRQDRYVGMREFSNHAVLLMSDSTMAVSSKYTQDLSVQVIYLSYIVDLFAGLHQFASASAHTLLKLASSVRVLLTPYGGTLSPSWTKPFNFPIHLLDFQTKVYFQNRDIV